MSEEMLTLDDLAKLKKQREEEKSKLPYKAYLDNLKSLVYENNPKLSSSIKEPKANNNQYVCIREPLEFINLFNACNGQDECKELFQKLLDERNSIYYWFGKDNRCPSCHKPFCLKKTGEEIVNKENVSVLVNTNTRNRKGEVVGSQEQYVPGERITYRVNKVCKKCGKSCYSTYRRDMPKV